jgi:hypothetical protein
MVWIWKTINLHTSLPHQLTSRWEVCQSYLPTFQDAEQSHRCSMAGTHCSSPKKYISLNFPTLYQRKDTPLILTHVESGLWMHKVGHSHSLTACLVHYTTGHAPIGAFCSRFFPEESTACRCGFPVETVSHVLYQCLSHEWESEPKEQLHYLWLLKFLEVNGSVFVFGIP